MVKYLPERCMRQFGRVQMIARSPFEAAPDTVTRVSLTPIFKDWAHHLVPEEYRRTVATQAWHCVDGYVTWFYRVSHPLMTPDAPGDPPMPAHEEILEKQHAEDDHATELLPVCQRIQMLGQDALDRSIIEQGGPEAVSIVERMVSDTAGATVYRRQRRSHGVRVRHTQQQLPIYVLFLTFLYSGCIILTLSTYPYNYLRIYNIGLLF
ncbi:uncharacterized protein LOC131653945 [Vicia villosa]|uniref:uncharacterized protein LOC131653945 n=1 Tax=Vicia villosa TaxID=3911 RepID=UPI00273B28D7|nr:uncharacterized protein LOC131653945 [Vicia villosa]